MVANGINGIAKGPTPLSSDTRAGFRVLESFSSSGPAPTLLSEFIALHEELDAYRNGKAIKADGQTLSIAAVTAVARYHARAILDDSLHTKERVAKAREVVSDKVTRGTSIYGLSTGFGGSADTRTDKPVFLGLALLQHLHAGVLPSTGRPSGVLPLHDPLTSMSMPESWVRAAMLIRMNSFVRGHSGVRWELIEKLGELLNANITPMVPLRGTISASGDLTALSYIGGTLMANPAIRVFHGPGAAGPRQTLPSREALRQYNIEPLPLASKEHLSILNGTAFSAAVAALAMNDAVHLTLLGQVCTAMGTEALTGTRGSFDPFIHATARPHPGQIEFAQNVYDLLEGSKFARLEEEEVGLRDDTNLLRQDRYPLRTSPQFLGPQIEDILSAFHSITQECNSTTDNPLVDSATGKMHHGGNFQAMAVTNAMEKTRLALHHVGKLIFAQCTELLNPAMNNGLPPSLAATDPSLNYFAKGIDAATASYVSELGFLANPVSTHIQSAEMHNQAVNSLALISARATVTSIDVLTMLISSYLYVLCQALDLRALQSEFTASLKLIIDEELASAFASSLTAPQIESLAELLFKCMKANLDKTTTMDNTDRMRVVASSATPVFIDFFSTQGNVADGLVVNVIDEFRTKVAERATMLLDELRKEFLGGARGPAPAQSYLNKTRPVYEFVRITLGVPMHGVENYSLFENGLGVDDLSIGQNISIIHEAIRDGQLQSVIVSLFDGAA